MTNELKIFYDKGLTKEVSKEIEFEPIIAGKDSQRSLFIQNLISYKLNLNISVENKDIKITKNIIEIKPNEIKEISLLIKPKLTIMKPITAKLNIKIDYLII